jgi:fimbrial chaperone protein
MSGSKISMFVGVAVIWAGLSAAVRAEGFDVRPVTLEAHQGAASFTVSNPGDSRVYIETTVYAWSKDGAGRDVLTESSDAIVSPPAMWMPPHGSYLVRVRLPLPAPGREGTYRVAVQNVPDRSQIVGGHIVFAVTQSLPAFSEPEDLPPPDLHGSLEGGRLYISNSGGRRARISGISQDGKTLAQGLLGYSLGGARLGLDVQVHAGRIEVATDMGMRTLDVH